MGLVEKVQSRVSVAKPGPRGFFHRLTPEAQKEFLEVRRQFQSGELKTSAKALAEILATAAAEDGIPSCGPQGLRAWLASRD